MKGFILILTVVYALTLIALGISMGDAANARAASDEAAWRLRRADMQLEAARDERDMLQRELADILMERERERLSRLKEALEIKSDTEPEPSPAPAHGGVKSPLRFRAPTGMANSVFE